MLLSLVEKRSSLLMDIIVVVAGSMDERSAVVFEPIPSAVTLATVVIAFSAVLPLVFHSVERGLGLQGYCSFGSNVRLLIRVRPMASW